MIAAQEQDPTARQQAPELGVLDNIARRVLWLSTQIVHHANTIRHNPDGAKVGGHQASSASVVGIMTALYFDFLRAGDRVAVKPHASPVFHAIQYLLGNLDASYLTTLRAFHGLQAYPSRTKDPDGVDFSTGSVGLGAVAPAFAALVGRYVEQHFDRPAGGAAHRPRFVSVVGDAELDEGSVWEAIAEPSLRGIGNILWVVDLNRQSLDRVVPEIRTPKLEAMFRANDWRVVEAKYGHQLETAFARPGGELLRLAIDEMPNTAYQRMLRAPAPEVHERLCSGRSDAAALRRFLAAYGDEELAALVRNLGGHDLQSLRRAYAAASGEMPTVVFAYTIKGWGLPIEGDPLNHSALLSAAQMEALRHSLGIPPEDPFPRFAPGTPEDQACAAAAARLRPVAPADAPPTTLPVPEDLGHSYGGSQATQAVLGQILVGLARAHPEVGKRLVTASPDVATSTNLGGWINRVGVWSTRQETDYFGDAGPRVLQWVESATGQHIELGISENNLCLLLGQLGLSQGMHGELLLPIGTLYDPFVARGLDALIYGVYSGARFVIVGTPSGITLSPEGGAHQSTITPAIGLALPGLVYYEPCFAKELEWILLDGLRLLSDRAGGESLYLRLTTRAVDQGLLPLPSDPSALAALRRFVLAGAYRLRDRAGHPEYRPGENVVQILTSGALIPEALAASEALLAEGVLANVINVTSADRLYRGYQAGLHAALRGDGFPDAGPLGAVIPPGERAAPVVTVLDGHPAALAWVGGALGTRVLPLGVTRFGESGARDDLYSACAIDVPAIVEAALLALDT